jgi:hypothetical protein
MYMQLTSAPQPARPQGMAGYNRENYRWMFYPPPFEFAKGMGCAGGKCDCGGTCHGMGDATDTFNPAYFLDQLSAQTLQLSDAVSASSLGTWVLVGLTGFGLWSLYRSTVSGVRGLKKRTAKRKRRKKKLEAARQALKEAQEG